MSAGMDAAAEAVARVLRAEFVGQGASGTTWEDYEHEARTAITAALPVLRESWEKESREEWGLRDESGAEIYESYAEAIEDRDWYAKRHLRVELVSRRVTPWREVTQ